LDLVSIYSRAAVIKSVSGNSHNALVDYAVTFQFDPNGAPG